MGVLVAFLRQLGVQDQVRRHLDSDIFTGRVPLRISEHSLKWNIQIERDSAGVWWRRKKKNSTTGIWHLALKIFTCLERPLAPFGEMFE